MPQMRPACDATKSDQIIKKILEFDEAGLREQLAQYLQEMPMADVFMNVVIPVLKKIGELWQVDSINTTHEHFFSNILRIYFLSSIICVCVFTKLRRIQ
jgi:hypothetical protein